MKKIFTFILFAAVIISCVACVNDGNDVNNSSGVGYEKPKNSGTPLLTPNIMTSPTPFMTGTENGAIANFEEGTIVDIDSVPEVASAIKDKYGKVTITSVTHAMHLDKQVYEVKFSDKDGVTHTAYVSADGKTVTDAAGNTNSPAPQGSTSPSPSESPTTSESPKPSESPNEEG